MHNLSTAIFLILLSAVYSAVLPKTLYEQIENVKDDRYKCPYLRETLLKPDKFEFLQTCRYSTRIQSPDEQLCLLYFNNFLELCFYSTEYDIKTLLNESTVTASLLQPKSSQTCNFLTRSTGVLENSNRLIAGIVRKLGSGQFCEEICTDLENNTTPICTISGLLRNISIQVSRTSMPTNQRQPNTIKGAPAQATETIKPKDDKKNDVTHTEVVPKQEIGTENVQGKVKVPEVKTPEVGPQKGAEVGPQNVDKVESQNTDKIEPQNGDKVGPQKGAEVGPHKGAQDELMPKTVHVAESEVVKKVTEKGGEVGGPPEKKAVEETPAVVPAVDKKPDDAGIDLDVAQERPYESEEDPEDTNLRKDDEDIQLDEPKKEKIIANGKPKNTYEEHPGMPSMNSSSDDENSFFFTYFMMVCAVFIIGYIGYHNKQKVLALVIEGRRGRRSSRRASGRPNSANYHKLDSNLEEAVTSGVQKNPTNVIY